MLEKIEIDKKGSSSQKSWQKPHLIINHNKTDQFNQMTEMPLNRVDRGFTIHDIERTTPGLRNDKNSLGSSPLLPPAYKN